MQTSYVFHSDPGHGWLQVPLAELDALGIAEQISRYSYRKGDSAFLEEDCDLSVFMQAKRERGEPVEFLEAFKETTPVRDYPSFFWIN